MSRDGYRYAFDSDVKAGDIESLIHLAILSASALYGETTVRLEARYTFHSNKLACFIECESPLGADLNRLFTGYVKGKLGSEAFTVTRLSGKEAAV